VTGISINDLRKEPPISRHMERECRFVTGRYGMVFLTRPLITAIRPAARSRIRVGRHQHGPQPGIVRHQLGPSDADQENRAKSSGAVEIEL